MEYKTNCGCMVVSSPPNFEIKYCPLHKSAPDLYEELKLTRSLLIDLSAYAPHYWAERAKARIVDSGKAIAKAEGG